MTSVISVQNTTARQVAHETIAVIEKMCTHHDVLWLLSGGSNISLQTQIAQQLSANACERITISLADERFVPLNDPHSNWQQLHDANFPFERFQTMPVLIVGKSAERCAQIYTRTLQELIDEKLKLVATLGIGTDGHTAGLLPYSPALVSKEMVATYQADDYQRITITPALFKHLDAAILIAHGDSKAEQLKHLQAPVAPNEQPAQLIKQVARVVVYHCSE